MPSPTFSQSLAARKAPSLQALSDMMAWTAMGDSHTLSLMTFLAPYGFTTVNGGVASQTGAQILTRLQAMSTAELRTVKSFWGGANADAGGYPTTLGVYAAAHALLIGAGNIDCIYIGQINFEFGATSYYPLGAAYLASTQFNADLLTAYGAARVYDPNPDLLAAGTQAGQDATDEGRRVCPTSLRLNNTHLNDLGNAVIAPKIYAKWAANVGNYVVTAEQMMAVLANVPSVTPFAGSRIALASTSGLNNFFNYSFKGNDFERDGRCYKVKAWGSHLNGAATKKLATAVYENPGASWSYPGIDSGALASSAVGAWELEQSMTRLTSSTLLVEAKIICPKLAAVLHSYNNVVTGINWANPINFVLQATPTGTQSAGEITQTLAMMTKEMRA